MCCGWQAKLRAPTTAQSIGMAETKQSDKNRDINSSMFRMADKEAATNIVVQASRSNSGRLAEVAAETPSR